MNWHVHPTATFAGTVAADLPGDKSISHRAALFAALAHGQSRIANFQVSGVTRPLLDALRALGIPWELDGTQLTVHGRGLNGWRSPTAPLDCGSSATTLRLLTGAAAAVGAAVTLDGSPGLRARPMARVTAPLRALGVPLTAAPGERAPLTLAARPADQPLGGLDWTLPVASAQVKSAILLAGLAAEAPVTVTEPGPSRDHTERLLAAMGAAIQRDPLPGDGWRTTLQPGASLRPLTLTIPGDFSAAAFLIVAALIVPGATLRLEGVGLNPTRTGLLDVLLAMGADLTVTPGGDLSGEPVGTVTARASRLHGTTIAGTTVVRMIDEFPILAVAAAYATGETVVRDAAELRLKESDRIDILAGELHHLGVAMRTSPDGFTLRGGPVGGGTVAAHGDHRLAMALSVAGLAAQSPVCVQDAHLHAESFPRFPHALRALGAVLTETP
jgi:3-phosphoshikimate 1-carboxyvinyltransferase